MDNTLANVASQSYTTPFNDNIFNTKAFEYHANAKTVSPFDGDSFCANNISDGNVSSSEPLFNLTNENG